MSIKEFAPFQPTVVFETDASMGGIGAYSPSTGSWFAYNLSQREVASAFRRKSRCMGELELRAIAMALVTFAPDLAGASILCITDNHESAVAVNNRSSKIPKFRHLSTSLASQPTATTSPSARASCRERRTGALTCSRNFRWRSS